jgi:hypothetical protein
MTESSKPATAREMAISTVDTTCPLGSLSHLIRTETSEKKNVETKTEAKPNNRMREGSPDSDIASSCGRNMRGQSLPGGTSSQDMIKSCDGRLVGRSDGDVTRDDGASGAVRACRYTTFGVPDT